MTIVTNATGVKHRMLRGVGLTGVLTCVFVGEDEGKLANRSDI